MNRLPDVTWIGIAAKYGGFLGGVGYETTSGDMINLGTYDRVLFHAESLKVGLGLGGGAGAALVMALNCPNILTLCSDDYIAQKDVSVGVALGGKWSSFAKSSITTLRPLFNFGTKRFSDIIRLSRNADDIRNLGHLLYSNYAVFTQGRNEPQFICIDIPVGGYAAELSLTTSFQKFWIQDFIPSPPVSS